MQCHLDTAQLTKIPLVSTGAEDQDLIYISLVCQSALIPISHVYRITVHFTVVIQVTDFKMSSRNVT